MNFFGIFKDIVNFIFVINIFLAILVILFERRNASSTWTWLMIMFFIPIVGFILYLFIGQDLRKQKFFYYKKEEEENLISIITAQKNLLLNDYIVKSNNFLSQYHEFIKLNLTTDNAVFTHNNDIELLNNGDKKFPKLIKCLNSAENFIHMQYYIFNNDTIGNEILNILIKKAKEGVEVKLLYDGMGCIKLPKNFFQPLIDAGGSVACFFPPFIPYINLRVNYRNHRKLCNVDGIHGFIGGLNIGDEYLGRSKKFGFWRDIHLYITGDAVDSLETRFLLDWRFAAKEDVSMEPKYFPKRNHIGYKGVQIISSGPDSQWGAIRNAYLKMINRADKNIYIETPYLVPDDSILTALKIASLSGIDVRIIIPSRPDHPFVYWASKSYVWELMEAGVKCYIYNKGFIHSKMIAIDSKICSIGTANWDMRSFNLNFEVNAMIYDEKTTAEVEETFLKDIEVSTFLTDTHMKNRSFIEKVKESVSRLLSPVL